MNIRAVIFDCDGTLVDSETLAMEVLVDCVRPHGLEMTVAEATERFKGGKMADCISLFEQLLGQALPNNFEPIFRTRCAQVFEDRLQPIAGAHEVLKRLHLPYCLASSGPRIKIDLNLRVTGLAHFFGERIFSAYDIGKWKPDPSLFLHAAQAMGVAPEQCAVVEDSLPGVQAGIAAGMHTFVLEGQALPIELSGSVHVLGCLEDLLTWFSPIKG
jgi:HAD superfamily hydrolase (TIGR01509 family)